MSKTQGLWVACTPSTCWWLRWHMEFKKGSIEHAHSSSTYLRAEQENSQILKRRFEGKRRRKFWGFLFGRFAACSHREERGFFFRLGHSETEPVGNGCLAHISQLKAERHLMLNVWTTYAVRTVQKLRTAFRGAICRWRNEPHTLELLCRLHRWLLLRKEKL